MVKTVVVIVVLTAVVVVVAVVDVVDCVLCTVLFFDVVAVTEDTGLAAVTVVIFLETVVLTVDFLGVVRATVALPWVTARARVVVRLRAVAVVVTVVM